MLSFIILLTVGLLYKQFLVISFDPVLAATLRLPAELLRNLMLVLLALTVVVSLQTVGVSLAAAMLVTPAATAYLLTRRLLPMMLVSALIGAMSSVIGLICKLLFEYCLWLHHSTNGYCIFSACILVEANEVCIMDLSLSTNSLQGEIKMTTY